MTDILMPKATAVWLVDNTSLTFEQIADFCGLHPLEVRGIADGDVARDIRGADPIVNGQLTREELDVTGWAVVPGTAWPAANLYDPNPDVSGLQKQRSGLDREGQTDTVAAYLFGLWAFSTLKKGFADVL